MRVFSNYFLITVFFVLCSIQLNAQADCVLGVGVTSDSVLISVFQLNPMQSQQLEKFNAELKYRHEILENKLENVRKRHPQSTVSDLSKLAGEYTSIMDSMTLVQTMIDKRLLTVFNEKQYNLYRNLCREVSRSPFIVAPTIYGDTVVVKKRSPFLDNLPDRN